MIHSPLLAPMQEAPSSFNSQSTPTRSPRGYSISSAPTFNPGLHLSTQHRVYQPWLADCKACTSRPNDFNQLKHSQALFTGTNLFDPLNDKTSELPPTPPVDGIKGPLISCQPYSPEKCHQQRLSYHQHSQSQVMPDMAMRCFNARLYQANCNILPSSIESHDRWWMADKQRQYLATSNAFTQTSLVPHMFSGTPTLTNPVPAPQYDPPFSSFNVTRNAHHTAFLAVGEHLPTTNITRRCARCRCPNCLSPYQVKNSSGKREHICHFPNCGKVYGKTSHLKAHIRWHLGERPFMCHWMFCGKSFTRSDELQRHLRTHTGEKKFKCSICEKRFMRSDHLSKHIKIHQKDKAKKQEPQSTSKVE